MRKKLLLYGLCMMLPAVCVMGCGAASEETERSEVAETAEEKTEISEAAKDSAVSATETKALDTVDEEADNEADQPLYLSILGDSISTYRGWIPEGYSVFYPENGEVTDVSQTWWMQVLEQTGMELCVNGSSAGCTCIGDSLSLDDPLNGCSEYRISQLVGSQGRMPDVIIVYMGTNDMLNGIPIGDNDGTRCVEPGAVENFSDAYTLILDELESDYPGAQIYCCTLLPIGDWGTEPSQPFVTFVNELDLTSEDYSAWIRVIADNRGIPVIELADCGISIDNLHEYVTDGVHPKPAGMELVAKAVWDALE